MARPGTESSNPSPSREESANHRFLSGAGAVLSADTKLRSSKYLNNLIEQDHRGVKQRIATMLGLKGFCDRGDYDRRY